MVPSALLYRHLRRWPTMQRISLAWIAWRKGWPQRQRIQVKATEPANPWRHVIMRFWTSMLKYAQIFFGHPVSHMSHRLPLQTKKKLQKFLDSIVQKSGKIRALLRDVRQEYSRSEMMSRHHIEIDIYIYICDACSISSIPVGLHVQLGVWQFLLQQQFQKFIFSCQAGKDSWRLAYFPWCWARLMQQSDGQGGVCWLSRGVSKLQFTSTNFDVWLHLMRFNGLQMSI